MHDFLSKSQITPIKSRHSCNACGQLRAFGCVVVMGCVISQSSMTNCCRCMRYEGKWGKREVREQSQSCAEQQRSREEKRTEVKFVFCPKFMVDSLFCAARQSCFVVLSLSQCQVQNFMPELYPEVAGFNTCRLSVHLLLSFRRP